MIVWVAVWVSSAAAVGTSVAVHSVLWLHAVRSLGLCCFVLQSHLLHSVLCTSVVQFCPLFIRPVHSLPCLWYGLPHHIILAITIPVPLPILQPRSPSKPLHLSTHCICFNHSSCSVDRCLQLHHHALRLPYCSFHLTCVVTWGTRWIRSLSSQDLPMLNQLPLVACSCDSGAYWLSWHFVSCTASLSCFCDVHITHRCGFLIIPPTELPRSAVVFMASSLVHTTNQLRYLALFNFPGVPKVLLSGLLDGTSGMPMSVCHLVVWL